MYFCFRDIFLHLTFTALALKDMQSLTHLNVETCGIHGDALSTLRGCCAKLETLYLRNNKIGPEGARNLGKLHNIFCDHIVFWLQQCDQSRQRLCFHVIHACLVVSM